MVTDTLAYFVQRLQKNVIYIYDNWFVVIQEIHLRRFDFEKKNWQKI